ncbi:MAG: PTS sugar transporter subunit IIA [candidate division KSB1 bacterium]|nr:PTS sugar transporter subunit IIA [candidate division KSB1 bacterium]
MRLKDLLSTERIKIPLESTTKEEIIAEMVDLLYQANKVKDKAKILQAILERERVMSTGVGDGVAIPHGKAEGVTEIAASFGITKENVDFNSLDEKPVRMIFLLVGPPDLTGPHLKALSRISRLMHKPEFREKLLASSSPAEVLEAIQEEEKYFEL